MGKGSGGQREELNSENDDKHLFSGGAGAFMGNGRGCRETALVLSRESNEYEGSFKFLGVVI